MLSEYKVDCENMEGERYEWTIQAETMGAALERFGIHEPHCSVLSVVRTGAVLVEFVIEAESVPEVAAGLLEKAEMMGGKDAKLLTVRRQGWLQ